MNRLEEFRAKLNKNKTPAELFLLEHLLAKFRPEQTKYRFPLVMTQVVVGWYIADFILPHKHLIIELDGSQHFTLDGKTDDFIRDEYFKRIGFDVLRYKNADVYKQINSIMSYVDLWASLESPTSNYFHFRRTVKEQNSLRDSHRLQRVKKSKELK